MLKDVQNFLLNPGQSIDLPVQSWHRLGNSDINNLVLIEIQIGDYFADDDIESQEDDDGKVE